MRKLSIPILFAFSIATLPLLSSAQSAAGITTNAIAALNDASASRPCDADVLMKALSDVAEELWPSVAPSHLRDEEGQVTGKADDFWKRIRPEGCRLVDIDNDEVDDLFVLSWGMDIHQEKGLGDYQNFAAILSKRRDDRGFAIDEWRVEHLSVFSQESFKSNPYATWEEEGWPRFRNCQIVVCDLDRNNRKDILFSYMYLGGSASAYYLRVFAMGQEMEIADHTLYSAQPVTVFDESSLRPGFLVMGRDNWRDDDCGASARARGYRHKHYRWNVDQGFVQF